MIRNFPFVSTPVVFPGAGESRQHNDNVQEGAEMVGGRVMPFQGAGFGSGEEGNRPKSPAAAFFQRTTIHTGGAELAGAELPLSEISGRNWHLVGIQEKCTTNNGF